MRYNQVLSILFKSISNNLDPSIPPFFTLLFERLKDRTNSPSFCIFLLRQLPAEEEHIGILAFAPNPPWKPNKSAFKTMRKISAFCYVLRQHFRTEEDINNKSLSLIDVTQMLFQIYEKYCELRKKPVNSSYSKFIEKLQELLHKQSPQATIWQSIHLFMGFNRRSDGFFIKLLSALEAYLKTLDASLDFCLAYFVKRYTAYQQSMQQLMKEMRLLSTREEKKHKLTAWAAQLGQEAPAQLLKTVLFQYECQCESDKPDFSMFDFARLMICAASGATIDPLTIPHRFLNLFADMNIHDDRALATRLSVLETISSEIAKESIDFFFIELVNDARFYFPKPDIRSPIPSRLMHSARSSGSAIDLRHQDLTLSSRERNDSAEPVRPVPLTLSGKALKLMLLPPRKNSSTELPKVAPLSTPPSPHPS